MSASDNTDNRINIGKIASILVAVFMISAGLITVMQFGVDTGSSADFPAEHFVGYKLDSGTWVNSDLGSAYIEGDFVSYQLRLDNSSKVWGDEEFSIKFNFYQSSTDAVFVDGFDTSVATGFQYSTNGLLADGVEVPSSGWGTHIVTPEAGETAASGDAQISNYMDVWEVGDPDSETNPNDMRYFTVKDLPWEDFTDGNVVIFFRAHLSLSIIWRANLESDLPQELDGNQFEGWTGNSPHNGSSYASGSSRHFTLESSGVGGKTIPIPISDYPKNVINVRKFINNVPFDSWLMNLEGKLSLWGTTGDDYVYIPYFPEPVQTGAGPWALGYCAFDGLPRGNYTVWEEPQDGFILDVIGTNPDLHLYTPGKLQYFDAATETWMVNPDADSKVRFDLERGTKINPKTEIIDFYNLEVGDISGYKIHDVNGDGTVDAGESGLARWTIELYEQDGISPIKTTTTNDTGYFEFTNVRVGNYVVKEVMQEGWYNTTPMSENVCVGCASEIDSILFLNTMYSSICGYKVEDMNGNGRIDNADMPIEDWQIQLYKGDTLIETTYTNESGWFCFDELVPGHYMVKEVMRANWYYTNALSFTFDIESGDHEEVTFMNTEKVSICGYKYEDMNGNGVWNEGTDLGLSGWTIYLFNGTIGAEEQPFKTTTTDSTGYFCFTGLPVGEYTVKEQMQSGWYSTSNEEVSVSLTSGGSKDIMFLNTEKVHICGFKYEDMNGNGAWDEGDLGLSGWTIYLFNGTIEAGEQPFKTTTTANGGGFCFRGLLVGEYTVMEQMQSGWYSTSNEEVTVTLMSGESTCIEFLNTHFGQICVFKYEDMNGDGEWQEGEPGVAGVTIDVYASGEIPAGAVEPLYTQVTNSTGWACFDGLFLGQYLVVETPLAGTYPSDGTSEIVDITMSDQTVMVSFGNIEKGRICVYKYEDINGNGRRDTGENTLLSVHVGLWKDGKLIDSGTTSTCPCGCLCFLNLVFGTYIVNETVPEGWYNTTSSSMEVVINESGEIASVTFLNTEYSSICGQKLEDMDGDGCVDASDQPIEDWEVQLWLGDDLVDTEWTDDEGYFCFDMLVPGDYTVVEVMQDGYYNTTPAEVEVNIVSGDHVSSVLFLNTQYSSVCGYKLEDMDGDGVDDEESGIANWEIRLYKLDDEVPVFHVVSYTLVATNFTDENGRFCFTNLMPGQYMIEEIMQDGWYNTTAMSHTFEITSGDHEEFIFMNTEASRICGYKVEDLDGDGNWDIGETGVEGWYIALWKDGEYCSDTLTAADGSFCFANLSPGDYVVYEGENSSWYNTSADFAERKISSGTVVDDIVFLNTQYGHICVWKYEDENGNGVRDKGEDTPVNGVLIELLLDGEVVDHGYTGQCHCMCGGICFGDLVLGNYSVRETVGEGWYTMGPLEQPALIDVSGERIVLTFVNIRLGQICVFKYQDLNGDGDHDENEPAQSGVTIQLWSNGSMIDCGVTGEDGKVCFTGLELGDYVVNETVPEGWYATNGTSFEVTIDESGQYIELEFLNTEYGSICVYKYEDVNGNGIRDAGEPAVEGVFVTLRDSEMCWVAEGYTDEDGIICFNNLILGTYSITETLNASWYSENSTTKQATVGGSGECVSVTFLNIRYGQICVFKYEDLNGDGQWQDNEPGVANITIELRDLAGQLLNSSVTGEDGRVCFTGLMLGTYTIKEILPNGWYAEEEIELAIIDESGEMVHIEFANIRYGQICVFKYEDLNGDGIWQKGEPGVENVIVTLMQGDEIIDCGVTDECGVICFTGLELGEYTVIETVPNGWYNTSAASVDVVIGVSGEQVCATFLNTAYGSICVCKYEDVNGNGELDDGDAVVPGITITLYDAQMMEIANGTTGECGCICFTGLVLGTYYVEETLTSEWFTEGPTVKQVVVDKSGEQVGEYFLNIRYGKICVFKFEDLNGDGVWQENEPGLADVVIELVQDCKVIRSGETNSTGWICFDLLSFGTYCVRENLALSDMDCCWYNSTPDRVRVTINGENRHELVTFGNVKYGKICGYKYFDANENGLFDYCTETGIAGWEIQLWLDGSLFAMTHTDSHGHFCFAGLEFGDYTVIEVMQDGWYATGPTQWNVSIDRSGDREDVFFLNAQCGKICVFKYEDLDGDGEIDVGEPTYDVAIHLFKNGKEVGSGWTGEDGKICFEDLTTGTYVVMEEVPCGWYNTSARIQEVVMTGEDVTVNFLNTEYGCIRGYKFNDANENGKWDMLTESGIQGWGIELYQDGELIAWTTTDASGYYSFCGLRIGNYEVSEVMQSGWMNTNVTEIEVSIEMSGQIICHVDFFNIELNPCIDIEKRVSYDSLEYESHTQGYWKNHPCAWVGLDDDDMFPWVCSCKYPYGLTNMKVFNTPPKGDATLILAHQYLAAKLNDLKWGAPAMYADVIADAEAFLMAHPIGCGLTGDEKDEATDLAELLTTYNEGESELGILTYTVVVTNCGNVALYNVEVYDSLLEQWFYLCDFGDHDGILDVGEWWTFTYTYVIPANVCGDDEEEPSGGCGGWLWQWDWSWGCGGGCDSGCGGESRSWSNSWGCGDQNGWNDGGCGGWNWDQGCGSGCGGWEWSWGDWGCGCCCGDDDPTGCIITNIATAYGQWGDVEANTWVSDWARVDFTVEQEGSTNDGGCDGGCGDWNWNWGCGDCGSWDWNWGCGNHDGWNHGGCGDCGGWDWNWGCGWDSGMNSGCRWWGMCNDGMIGACYFHNAGPRSDDENRDEDQIEGQEAPESNEE